MGKRLNTYFALNNSPEVLLSQMSYDPYGRMVSQAQGGHTSSYTYNIRSWLTEISNPYFLQRMQYQDVGSASQWGGNIAKMSWSAGPNATLNYYQYTYDGISRLSSALYNGSATSMYSRSYAYDLNSNVTSVAMGQSSLSFALSGNRLSNGTYDSKGRLTSNTISQYVTSITYNPLDLPMQIVLSGNKSIENKYLADGSKLQSRLCSPGDTLTKVYIGNLILHNGQLHTLLTENGYIDFTGSTPQYRYFIKDHLGNNRVVTDSFGNVLQRNNYDPYGNPLAASSEATPYQYGGKEKIWSATLDWYDYCARYYQPILGRFTTIDPMSEKYYSISPYAYCAGNPVNLVDLDGERPIYSTEGRLLGTDDEGLQGEAIIMERRYFHQGMAVEEALKYDLGKDGLVDNDAVDRFETNYSGLNLRPDWDGYLTLEEANEWYRSGNGAPLYVSLEKIDLSGWVSLGEHFVNGKKKLANLFFVSASINDALVYGTITLVAYPNHSVRAFSDTYDFRMKSWLNPTKWGRNIATTIGKSVAGQGTEYEINIYGSKKVKPVLPWIK